MSLREQQVIRLQREIAHQAGVRLTLRKKDCMNSIAFVNVFNHVSIPTSISLMNKYFDFSSKVFLKLIGIWYEIDINVIHNSPLLTPNRCTWQAGSKENTHTSITHSTSVTASWACAAFRSPLRKRPTILSKTNLPWWQVLKYSLYLSSYISSYARHNPSRNIIILVFMANCLCVLTGGVHHQTSPSRQGVRPEEGDGGPSSGRHPRGKYRRDTWGKPLLLAFGCYLILTLILCWTCLPILFETSFPLVSLLSASFFILLVLQFVFY